MRTLALPLALAVVLAAPALADDEPALVEPVRRLLDLEDRRIADPAAWTPLLRSPLSEVRRRAARGAGRARAVALGPALRAALGDETDAAVQAELVFALGLTNDPASLDLLVALLHDERAALRARAVAALARHGAAAPPAVLLPALADADAEVRGAAALALARLRGRRANSAKLDAPTARALLAALGRLAVDADTDVRWRAAYALADLAALDLADGGEQRLRLLERLLDDPAPFVRLFAARGLAGHPGDPGRRADALLRVLRGQRRRVDDPHVRAALVAALGRVGLQGARERITAALLEELAPGGGRAELSSHVAAAAFGALAGLGRAAPADAPAPALRTPLAAAARAFLEGPERVHTGTSGRAAAIDALLRVGAPEATGPLVTSLSGSSALHDRLAVVAAARWLPAAEGRALLGRLRADPSVLVQAAALDAWSGVAEVDSDAAVAARTAALAALREADLAVRGTAVSLLASVGQAGDLPALAAAVTASGGADWAELRGEAARTALAWARADGDAKPEAKSAVAAWLRTLQKDEALAVRTAAATALAELEGTPPPPTSPKDRADDSTSTVQVEPGVDLLLARPNPRAVLRTTRGDVVLELLREEAPRHVKSFLTLARAGRYDGLPLHRVVTGFVVQGLDPRGDGWGSGGVRLRDELNAVPFLRGAVGMPSSGPDTGGCQLFITHIPTPHLDGGYTVFARTLSGLDVVDLLDVGDVVQRVELLPAE